MGHARRQLCVFTLEGLNAFASAYYFNYLFFLLRDEFGFGQRENLLVGALHGLAYGGAAWCGGRYAQRAGYRQGFQVGCLGMWAALVTGGVVEAAAGQLLVLAVWTVAFAFTWPALEALACEHEPPTRLPRAVGIYNVVWAGASALAYFGGGALFERLGRESIFWLPATIHAIQFALARWLKGVQPPANSSSESALVASAPASANRVAAGNLPPRLFLRLAWLANPFAYIAINTFLASVPALAPKLGLTTPQAGLFGSLWFFARLATFAVLWGWTGWHYRFGWLLGAFLALIVSFATLLLSANLWLSALAQIVFGVAVGLIYYSSLFYSMDAGEAKGEHGGIHEAAIGAGLFVGPAIGAGSLSLWPQHAGSGALAVSVVLCGGLVAFLRLRATGRTTAGQTPSTAAAQATE
jgi:MFS family permease